MKFALLAITKLRNRSLISPQPSSMMAGTIKAGVIAMASTMVFTACDGQRETREIMNMPDMHYSPAFKAQEENPYAQEGPMFLPPEGTVPVNFVPYTITDAEADEKASLLENPLPKTEDVLLAGQKYYDIHCAVCHGHGGDGLGTVIKANAGMPMPPKLYSEKIRTEWTDGRIFHVITNGQGNMPSYNARLKTENRWAVIHYVRALGDAWEQENNQTASNDTDSNGEAASGIAPDALANFADPELISQDDVRELARSLSGSADETNSTTGTGN